MGLHNKCLKRLKAMAYRYCTIYNDNEIHLFKPNFIYTMDNKYCL